MYHTFVVELMTQFHCCFVVGWLQGLPPLPVTAQSHLIVAGDLWMVEAEFGRAEVDIVGPGYRVTLNVVLIKVIFSAILYRISSVSNISFSSTSVSFIPLLIFTSYSSTVILFDSICFKDVLRMAVCFSSGTVLLCCISSILPKTRVSCERWAFCEVRRWDISSIY